MNILCTIEEFFKKDFPEQFNVIMNPYKRRLTEEEAGDYIEKYQPVGIIAGVEPLTREVLQKAKNLKVISRHGIGLDSVDLKAASELGIRVVNTPDAPTVAVAELAVGLMLCLVRGIVKSDDAIRQEKWLRQLGFQLQGKTVGIIGCGRIGTYVSRLLQAFGSTIIGFDPYIKKHDNINLVSFDRLICDSDIISLHIPYTQENRFMIGTRQFDMMKKSALLINTARGGIIDEDALYVALSGGKIAGAAMDCFVNEPYTGKLAKLDNIILTPHLGSFSIEAKIQMEEQSVANLIKALKELGLM